MTNYLLKNAYFPFQESLHDIYVESGKIQKISGQSSSLTDLSVDKQTQVIDLQKRIVIPGFVDAHTHLDKTLIGNKVSNQSGTLDEAIQLMKKYKKRMTKEEVRERAERYIIKAMDRGTRYIRTHIDIDEEIQLESLKALIELREQYKNDIDIQLVAFPQEGIDTHENLFYLEEALQAGADLVGGIPALAEDPKKHIEDIFELAVKYDVDIDMHIDETDDPSSLTIKDLIEFTIKYGYEGRVTAGHLVSLAAYENNELSSLLEEIKRARINIISLPSTNLYLQGRDDRKSIRRGIAPIKLLYKNQLLVMIASDNNQDPFNPFGNGSLLEEALIAAHGCHMGGKEDLEILFDMVTVIPGRTLFDYSITEGKKANFIVLDSFSKTSAIIDQAKVYGMFHTDIFLLNN